MEGAEHGNTNIRLALLRSKELIQDVLFNGEEADRIADAWRAAIVLITDGQHVVPQKDGTNETERQVIDEVIDIDSGAAGLIGSRIDVACVGIGNDLNIDLLSKVASECTAHQMRMAARKKIDSLLIGGSLFVKVDAGDVNFGSVIRTFIDVSSGSA
jgi:Mg-chelatase subunit ChlD